MEKLAELNQRNDCKKISFINTYEPNCITSHASQFPLLSHEGNLGKSHNHQAR